jgi:uncharacterized membrane protein
MDTHSRSLAKAISWRITGSIDTMILSFLITGSMKFAAAIGLTEVVTKSVLYYLHERAWLRIPFGRELPAKTGPTKTGKVDFMRAEAYQPETGA